MNKKLSFSSLRYVISIFFMLAFFGAALNASSLIVETQLKDEGVSYLGTDFTTGSSSASYSYYWQQLQITIAGKISPQLDIFSKISSLGVSGSTTTIFQSVPYQKTDFSPYIENAYVRLIPAEGYPLELFIGKQNLNYGDGLIISDNGVGYNTFKIVTTIEKPFKGRFELFSAKVSEGFSANSDTDLYGFNAIFDWNNNLCEASFFQEKNLSGALYSQGFTSQATQEIVKVFYDFRIGKSEKASSYLIELAKQKGYVKKVDNTSIDFDGLSYKAYGELTGDKTKLGKITARAFMHINSGDDDTVSLDDNDESFSPTFTKIFDGLKRFGYGNLFAAGPESSFFSLPASYSGINTLSVGTTFTPFYAWDFDITYFLYSASVGPKGSPAASGFERIFGSEFSLGVEMDLGVKYTFSKFIYTEFTFSRYTPPKYETLFPNQNPAQLYRLSLCAHF